MRQPISMTRGTTQNITISLTDSSGNSRALNDSEVLLFGVKRKPECADYLIFKKLSPETVSASGAYVLTLEPSDTTKLDIGTYYYDVGLQSGTDYHNVIECSEFKLRANITSPEVRVNG